MHDQDSSRPQVIPDCRDTGQTSNRVFFGISALLFMLSTIVTIVWCLFMPAKGGMLMPGGWTMSMTWMRMPGQTWTAAMLSFLAMWLIMMIAMMLPSLLPMLWHYRRNVGSLGGSRLGRLTLVVGVGYFVVWLAFGIFVYPIGVAIAVVVIRWPELAHIIPILIGMLVIISGVIQSTSWKIHQLNCCREVPSRKLLPDVNTAWRHGLRLGVQCCYCCFSLMLIMLVMGMMNLSVMASVTVAITLERLMPAGEYIARITGAATIVVGILVTIYAF